MLNNLKPRGRRGMFVQMRICPRNACFVRDTFPGKVLSICNIEGLW